MAGKQYLMTPGPTPVPPQVLAALAEPVVHHRGSDFRPVYERCLKHLAAVYRSATEPLLFTASGTGAMESVLANLTAPGDRVVVVSAGSFGERWLDIARRYGCDVEHSLRYEWGETPSADDLAAQLERVAGVKLVLLTHSETSTGVVADVESLAAVADEAGALVAVDAVSSLGAIPLATDAWGLDAVVSGSQKALMTPPGLAFVALSQRAERAAVPQSFYFDWIRTRKAQDKRDSAFTPAVSLVRALEVALGLLLDAGLEEAFDRHRRLGRACREGVKALGLELFSPDDDSSAVVTAVRMPNGDLAERIGGYDAVVVRSATKLTAEVLEHAERLRVIGRAGVGVDNVDVEAATRRGIVVANAPESNVVSAAEHTIGLLVALARNIPQAHAALKQGRWERSAHGGVELEGKTLAVLGFGRIGQQVARRALGLGMRLAASTAEAQDRAGVVVAEQVAAALEGALVTHAVNIPSIGAEDLDVLGPYVPLAANLGRLAMELAGGRAEAIELTYYGGLADFDTRLLSVAALNGAFQGRVDGPVNYVNAPLVAAERGIDVRERRQSSSRDFTNLVRV